MRHTGIVSLVLAATLLMLGCGGNSSSTPSTNPDALTEAARAKRDEYVREMQKQLDVIDAKYKALEQRAAEARGDARKELDEKVKVAKVKRDAAAKKLDELKTAGADRWEKIKDGMGNAFDDLKKMFD